MKILHITPYKILPPNAGGERAIFYLLKALSKKISLLTLTIKDNAAQTPFDKKNELSNSKLRYANPLLILQIRKLRKQESFDFLMLEHPFISLFPTLFKRFINRPIIIRSHNIEYERFKTIGKWYWPIIKSLEKFVHARADYNFFITAEDLAIAVNEFSLDKKNCFVLPYGVELSQLPDIELLEKCKLQVRQKHGLGNEKILLFNGSLSYAPNQTAVEHIVEELLPVLAKSTIDFKIIICGKGLQQELVEKINKTNGIIYAGFVDNIDQYFMACDVFINPVVEGGGVKTKLIEALGFGKKVVSYKSGSYGTTEELSGGRLKIIADNSASLFATETENLLQQEITNDNTAFYKAHNWDHIAQQMIKTLGNTLH